MASTHNRAMSGYIFVLSVTLAILQINCQEMIHVLLEEERPGGTLVADIINEARLYDEYTVNVLSVLQFQISSDSDVVSRYFRIPTNTSNLVTKDRIDRDTLCEYQDTCEIPLDIIVQPPYFKILKFVIHITDINDNSPEFIDDNIVMSIPESASIGSSFDLEPAEDKDSGNFTIQEYQLLSFQDLFELRVTRNPDGTHRLSLVLKDTLDRENRSRYSLSIVAKDGGNPPLSGSAIIQVNVLDTNDNNPVFDNEAYHVYMSENNNVGSTVIRVVAHDLDEGASGEVEYEFSRQTQSVYGNLFQINSETGEITTKDVIDYEQNQEFNLRIMAKDKGPSGLTGYTQVTISVRDLNDNAPQISVNSLAASDEAQVLENRDPGEFVAHVSVTDPDGDNNGEFRCTINSNNFNLETEPYPTEFKITSAVRFDREIQSEYAFTMTCRDRGSPSQFSTERIVVNVLDENDHAPAFPREVYEIGIFENSGVGITVLHVNATDADAGENSALTFSLQHIRSYETDVLHIDSDSGIITTRISLDYETHQQYSYYVIVHDNGNPQKSATASLLLSVLDTNDNAPVFSQPRFSFTVQENTAINTVIGTVMAYDMDTAPYNLISYSLMSHGWDDYFNIDVATGEIRVTRMLDREQMGIRQSYDLIARASNDGYGLQNSVEVIVFVDDVNDNVPIITYPTENNNTVNIKSNTKKGRFVISVEATDLDIGRNGLLNYRILEHERGYDLFSIDRHTGSIYVDKDLRKHGNKEIELLIEVSDNAARPLSARTVLNIYINKTDSPSEKQLVTNLTFVIAVVVTSVILVAVVVVIFVIFMMRRNKQMKKTTTVYSYRVEAKDEDGKDGEDETSAVPTISGAVPTKGHEPAWPDVIDVNQIAYHEKPYYDRHQPSGNHYVSNVNSNKRVHFKDSLESVHSTARDPAKSSKNRTPFLEDNPSQGNSGGKPPMYLDEGRHKLLYGADARGIQLTSQNLKSLYRGQDGDELSDQGSSVDSGRGPSEEDPDPTRSSIHNNSSSLNDSRESGESNRLNRNNNYMDMNQARKHKLNAAAPSAGLSSRAKFNQRANNIGPNNSHKRSSSRLDSDSSFQSEPPAIPPRCAKPPIHPRTAVILPQISHQTQHSFPDINVPAEETVSKPPIGNIGKYNVRTGASPSKSHITPQQQNEQKRCAAHNVVDHFPELCKRQSVPLWASRDYVEPDTRSEGGSTTSGSYMVDDSADHLDLGPEISRDIFV